MKKALSLIAAAALLAALLGPAPLGAESSEAKKIDDCIAVVKEIMKIPEKRIPPALIEGASAIVIIPGVIKAGFIIGGRHGRGVVLVHEGGRWSNPAFISFTGGSIGWQIGAQATDVVLVFKSKRGVEDMIKGKFTLGADASVAAGPVGRQAEAATDAQLKAEIYSYSRSRGLFAGVSLEGSVLSIDEAANQAFYGKEDVTANEIFQGGTETPDAAGKLRETLEQYGTPAPKG
jgi:lipid-binding SYLF domain-containing protein